MVMQLINDPADREFRFLQADLLIEEEHMEEADEILQQLAMDEEYELDTLLDIILNYVDVNQKEYAKKWIDCLFAHFDMQTLPETNQRLRDVLCDYYSTFNKPDLAIPYLNMTLNEFPYSVQHWNELGKCYLQQEQYENAHEAFDFALAIDENNTETLTLKAFLYSQTANIKESINYYLRLEKATREEASRLYGIGRSPLRDEGLRNRHEVYTKAVKTETGDYCIRANRYIASQPSVM